MNFTANYAEATYNHGYTLNDKNQRTSATLPDGNKWNYTYDVMGQLTGAVKQDTANNSLANMNYFYDLIGNRTSLDISVPISYKVVKNNKILLFFQQ